MADSGDQKKHYVLKLALSVGFSDSSSSAADAAHDRHSNSRPAAAARSPRSFAAGDGAVGLAIVAAMSAASEEPAAGLARSDPVPIGAVVTKPGLRTAAPKEGEVGEDMELSESYTCVISHLGGNRVKKRVYFGDDGLLFEPPPPPPPGLADPPFVVAEFLRCCFLCKKKLDGMDVYMYRGEKAFCSEECRCQQMLHDELGEQFASGAPKNYECSSSPYASSLVISAGVAAA
ncbi:unnamed protein product [Musa acuminata subsp. malaccensis]|uniref:(wild Malaysian banana) hypothetical protein n=1 Tax=Musa acuminata subsp. malaccensis TaxID=214687 RepID=A0A804HZW9_MUSAM|nr:PREDICTED: uncharacterized protein LOC103972012 [Musa acuminata subsp. malaccensis]CAG1861274.1 unnamed protein product [Musa acuminata subsp. malaccensis]